LKLFAIWSVTKLHDIVSLKIWKKCAVRSNNIW
jgi:hypothetical protein